MMQNCGWSEAEAVDYVLGNLSLQRADELRAHTEYCAYCRSRLEYWRQMAGSMPGSEQPLPPQLKQRLKRSLPASGHRKNRVRTGLWAPLAGFVIFLVVCGGLLRLSLPPVPDQLDVSDDYMRQMIEHPLAVRYQAEPTGAWDIQGAAWIKDDSDEMLLRLRGLPARNDKDYQAWFDNQNVIWNGGILQWREGEGFLYFRGTPVREADRVTIRLEPKGGSRSPTGPEAAWIYLQDRR